MGGNIIQKSVFAFVVVCLMTLNLAAATAQNGRRIVPSRDVGLDQKLDAQVPLDIPFKDENGKDIRLGDYVKDKPVILNLIFYKCPGVCTTELQGMVEVFNKLQFDAGREFTVITVSINPHEGPGLAKDKKESYLNLYRRPTAAAGWHFLTGTQESIQALAHVIGYRYAYDLQKDQFAHPAGLIILTPKGRISKYFFNSAYNPRDMRLALIEAADEHIGTPVDGFLLMCLHFDNSTGKYTLAVLNLLKVGAVLTLLSLGSFIFMMNRWERRYRKDTPTIPTATAQ